MCQSLHFALQEKQQPFSASDHTTADPELSNSANGDPAALRQITFARLKLLSVVLVYPTTQHTLVVDLDLEVFGQASPSRRR